MSETDTSHYEVRFVYMEGMPSTDRVETARTFSAATKLIGTNEHREEMELGDLLSVSITYRD